MDPDELYRLRVREEEQRRLQIAPQQILPPARLSRKLPSHAEQVRMAMAYIRARYSTPWRVWPRKDDER